MFVSFLKQLKYIDIKGLSCVHTASLEEEILLYLPDMSVDCYDY
jgi:hypothetical protein